MYTQKVVDHLTKQNIPSFSVSGVITELGQQELSLNQTLEQIESITDVKPDISDIHEARLMYLYLIQDGLRLFKEGAMTIDTKWMLDTTLNKAQKFKAKNAYVFATEEEGTTVPVKLNAKGEVKHKKGWKQTRAIELLKANPNMEKKDLIQLFITELDMTLSGATTYFYMSKKAMK